MYYDKNTSFIPYFINNDGKLALKPRVSQGIYDDTNNICSSPNPTFEQDFQCETMPKVICLNHVLEPTLESSRTTKDMNDEIVCVYDNCKNKCDAIRDDCYTYNNGIVKKEPVFERCVQYIPNTHHCRSLNDPNICPDRWYTHETNDVRFIQGDNPTPYYVPRAQSYRMNKALVPSPNKEDEYICDYSASHV